MPDVRYIDPDTLALLQQHPTTVHSVFTHTLNLLAGDTLITVSSRRGRAHHTVIVSSDTRFDALPIRQDDRIVADDTQWQIGATVFSLANATTEAIEPDYNIHLVDDAVIRTLSDLERWIQRQNRPSLLRHDRNDALQRYQFDKIDAFLLAPTWANAKNLVGMGQGLTPIGDDVLLGFLLARQAIGRDVPYVNALLEHTCVHTNRISSQMLEDVANHHYADHFRDMLVGVFETGTIDFAESFLSFGETSGLAILSGFLYGIKERNETHDRT